MVSMVVMAEADAEMLRRPQKEAPKREEKKQNELDKVRGKTRGRNDPERDEE